MSLKNFSIVTSNHEQYVFQCPVRLENYIRGGYRTEQDILESPRKEIYGYIMVLETKKYTGELYDFVLLRILSSNFCGWVYMHTTAPWYENLKW